MVRLKDIARQANVSVMTVSKALRDEPDVSVATKSRIKSLAQQMGYVPDSSAQGLRTRTTKLFGLVVPSTMNPIFARIVFAIEECTRELGYDLLLAHTHNLPDREEVCLRRLLSRRVDARRGRRRGRRRGLRGLALGGRVGLVRREAARVRIGVLVLSHSRSVGRLGGFDLGFGRWFGSGFRARSVDQVLFVAEVDRGLFDFGNDIGVLGHARASGPGIV